MARSQYLPSVVTIGNEVITRQVHLQNMYADNAGTTGMRMLGVSVSGPEDSKHPHLFSNLLMP
jgi:hypothetical protein